MIRKVEQKDKIIFSGIVNSIESFFMVAMDRKLPDTISSGDSGRSMYCLSQLYEMVMREK
jgi:hypothetical protein